MRWWAAGAALALGAAAAPVVLAAPAGAPPAIAPDVTRPAPRAPADTAPDSTFILASADPARAPSPFIGNGRLATTIPPLGIGAASSFLAGLYEHGPADVPRIVRLPAWNALDIHDGRRWLVADSAAPREIENYRQAIDMRAGVARTSYEWGDGSRRTDVRVETFVSRAAARVAVMRLTIVPRRTGRLKVRAALAGWPPPRRLALARIRRSNPSWTLPEIWYPGHATVRATDANISSNTARLTMTARPVGRTTDVVEAATFGWPATLPDISARTFTARDSASVELAFDATAGRSYTFTQLVSVATSDDGVDPASIARADVTDAHDRGWDALAAANADAWGRRWATDIEIDGDPQLQRLVRSMLFYLLCSADSGTALGIPPMGLSSAGYYGHVFWDSDTWMFPSLLVTHPDVARSLVAFRARTLGAATENARANGHRGAMYPWEADELGHETTPRFAAQNARGEIHITGDVALAQWQYYLATHDSAWLAHDGFPVIRETANFWLSRSTLDTAKDTYHIANVVSVSEGLIGVTDDAYTNAVARRNLEIADSASRRLGLAPDPAWARVAAGLHLPYDSASQFYRTYAGAPDSTLGDVTPLLAYPLGIPMSDRAKRAQLEQAVAQMMREGSGAMMGVTLLSVDAAELGDRALVDSLLPFGYRGHVRGPFLMLSETPTNDAVNFLTGAGGFLQQVLYGWTGLRLGSGGLEPAFPPMLPSAVRRLVVHDARVRGKRVDIIVDASGRRIVEHGAEGES